MGNRVASAAPAPAQQDDYSKYQEELMAFMQQMMKPLDPNDPTYKAILDQAQASALDAARNAGVQGPAAANMGLVQRSLAMSGLQTQRQQMGLNAAGMGLQSAYGLTAQGRQIDYQRSRETLDFISGLAGGVGQGLGAGVKAGLVGV